MDKPDVDSIDGLSPAISIDQKTTSRNPRSTVGTVTEIYDYLRLLYARVGHPHCPVCGRPITGQSAEQIVDQVLRMEAGTRFTVDAPLVRGRKGEFRDVIESLRGEGFTRIKVDGATYLIEEAPALDKKLKHDLAVVVDRLVMKDDLRRRLTDSIETSLQLAEGLVEISPLEGPAQLYSERFACPEHGVSLAELAPRVFSFNSPHGACTQCTGLGSQLEVDPELIVPDPALSIAEGAVAPFEHRSVQLLRPDRGRDRRSLGDRRGRAVGRLAPEHQQLFLNGTGGERVYVTYKNRMGRKRSYMVAYEGIVPTLARRYRETTSRCSASGSRPTCRCARALRARARAYGPRRSR